MHAQLAWLPHRRSRLFASPCLSIAALLPSVSAFFGEGLGRLLVDTGEAQGQGLVCPVCQKKFTRRDNLKSHFSNLHGEHRGPFRCSFCFKVTKNKMSLRAHMKNYHPANMQRRSGGGHGANNGNASDGAIKLDDSPLPMTVPLTAHSPLPLAHSPGLL